MLISDSFQVGIEGELSLMKCLVCILAFIQVDENMEGLWNLLFKSSFVENVETSGCFSLSAN